MSKKQVLTYDTVEESIRKEEKTYPAWLIQLFKLVERLSSVSIKAAMGDKAIATNVDYKLFYCKVLHVLDKSVSATVRDIVAEHYSLFTDRKVPASAGEIKHYKKGNEVTTTSIEITFPEKVEVDFLPQPVKEIRFIFVDRTEGLS